MQGAWGRSVAKQLGERNVVSSLPLVRQHQVTAAQPPPAVLVWQFPPTGTDPPFPYPAPQW